MKQKKTIQVLFVMLCLLAGLCGCKEETAAEEEYVPDESLYSFSEEAEADLEELRDRLTETEEDPGSGYAYALGWLGEVDVSECLLSVNQLAYSQFIAESGYEADYLFLAEIPSDKIVETDRGQQVFCVVPSGSARNVRVLLASEGLSDGAGSVSADKETQAETAETESDAVLYDRNCPDPVVLCVNSGRSAEVLVEITEEDGSVYTFGPRIRREDSRLAREAEALDFTLYPETADAGYLAGDWRCEAVSDDGGNTRYARIFFEESEMRAEYGLYAEDGTLLLHYSGTWSFAPDGLDNYEEGTLVLDLMSDGGVYTAAAASATPFQGAFQVQKGADGTLIVRNVYGDPLVYGTEYTDLTFFR